MDNRKLLDKLQLTSKNIDTGVGEMETGRKASAYCGEWCKCFWELCSVPVRGARTRAAYPGMSQHTGADWKEKQNSVILTRPRRDVTWKASFVIQNSFIATKLEVNHSFII